MNSETENVTSIFFLIILFLVYFAPFLYGKIMFFTHPYFFPIKNRLLATPMWRKNVSLKMLILNAKAKILMSNNFP